MALLVEKEDNESYTFRQMLKQPDTGGFVKVMIKEAADHETRSHWEVVQRSPKSPNIKTILAI